MNTVRARMIFLVAALLGFVCAVGAALNGCATSGFKEYHGVVTVGGPTRIVGGPIHGHWAVEDGSKGILVYTVKGDNCSNAGDIVESPEILDSGRFNLPPNTSLCMLPLVQDQDQYIQLHARRP